MRSILGNPFVQFLIGRTIGLYMLFVGVTTRWTRVNRAAVEPYWRADGGKLIGCIWHGRFSLIHKMWAFGPGTAKAKMLISQSREGGIVAHTRGLSALKSSAAPLRNAASKRAASRRCGRWRGTSKAGA